MKKLIYSLLLVSFTTGFSSCNKFLDVNLVNPNSATQVTPLLVLPQAIVGTASLNSNYNVLFSDIGGQFANSANANFSTSTVITYGWANSSITSIFTNAYRNVVDYQYILDTNKDDLQTSNSTAIAMIMKAFVFSKLVDQYNDVPYTEAFKGNQLLTPKYDKAEDIYTDLVSQLTLAIKMIDESYAHNVAKPGSVENVKSEVDPMFNGRMNDWASFANSLKLRLLIKMAGVPELKSFAIAEFAKLDLSIGFIEDDAVVNPGYTKEEDKQNPTYNAIAFNSVGTRAITSRIPSKWIFSFYNGGKINDSWRGKVIYKSFPNGPISQLGDISTTVPNSPAAPNSSWFTGANNNTNAFGIAKGPGQSQVIMLAAENLFLQAEAYLKGYLVGNAKTAFENGVKASFKYLYKDVTDVVDPSKNVDVDFEAYKLANPMNYLVNWDLTLAPKAEDYNLNIEKRQLEAIITQKYIALNTISSDEAFNEFRRTTYPYIVNGSLDPILSFASLESKSAREDRLPSRLLYPSGEITYNEDNVPKGISQFLSRIFWDLD